MGLDFYRSKTGRIRGITLEEKLQFLTDRYNKVVGDCAMAYEEGRDKSTFRIEFGQAHDYFCGKLKLIGSDKVEIKSILQEFSDLYENCDSPGWRDAYGYVIAELEKALEGT